MTSTETKKLFSLITHKYVPIHYWDYAPNFGDLLAPWLVEKITGLPTIFVKDEESRKKPHYVLVGSILSHVRKASIVWGTGAFGIEPKVEIEASYLAVRGPLTRNKIMTHKGSCPPIYGDPGLLVPCFYRPKIEKIHEVGVIIRHSEDKWRANLQKSGILYIDLKTDKIEETVDQILACKRIVSSSLHGLILADAYGIPNAWLDSKTPHGLDYKYWDYLISVDKIRSPTVFDFNTGGLTASDILSAFDFDDRKIDINLNALIDANPFNWNPDAETRAAVPLRKGSAA